MRLSLVVACLAVVLCMPIGGYADPSRSNGVNIAGNVVGPIQTTTVSWTDMETREATQKSLGISPPVLRVAPYMPRTKRAPLPSDAGKSSKEAPTGPDMPLVKAAGLPSLVDNFEASRDAGFVIPPDTDGAVGPSHLMVALNDLITVQTKDGSVVRTLTLFSFWNSAYPAMHDFFDPKVIFDPNSRRFIFVSCAERQSSESSMLLAVSATDSPLGSWHFYQFDGDASNRNWVDYPNLGVNSKWITFTANMFDTFNDNFAGVNVWVVNKTTAINGLAVTPTLFFSDKSGFTLVPALTFSGAEPTEYLVSAVEAWVPSETEKSAGESSEKTSDTSPKAYIPSASLQIHTVTGLVGAPIFTTTNLYANSDPWGYFNPDAPQLGSSARIATNDDRVINAILRDGHLWCAHTVGLPADFPTRTAAKWWEIDPVTGTTVQSGVIEDPETSYYFPSITVNAVGTVMMAFSGSSSSTYASAYYTSRNPSTPIGEMQGVGLIKAGESSYSYPRWGDYSATCVDPTDDFTMWTIQEYAASPMDTWGTWWAKFTGQDTVRNFRAAPEGPNNSVLLTWKNPADTPTDIVIVRKLGSFPVDRFDGVVAFQGTSDVPVNDGPLPAGTEYFYGLFADYGIGVYNDKHFYRAIVGDPKTNYFTEEFTNGTDLAFSQILFSPIYDSSLAEASQDPHDYVVYNSYVATVTKNVAQLPVDKTNEIRLYMPDNGYRALGLATPFPFFGTKTSTLYLAANGFASLQAIQEAYTGGNGSNPLNHPSLDAHFETPRISFLFGDLSPRTGGQVWARYLSEGLVVTFDKVPEFGSSSTNSCQVEFFYSGHILITYSELAAQHVVCGLSDGRGIPLDPLSRFPARSDLSNLGVTAHLTMDPIPIMVARAGGLISFVATVQNGPAAFAAVLPPSGSTLGSASGRFSWQTAITTPVQDYTFTITSVKGAEIASQDVLIKLTDSGEVIPAASNLVITPVSPHFNDLLVGQYAYSDPIGRPESGSVIRWYKNGTVVPTLNDLLTVPRAYTAGGDTWYFSVIPQAIDGTRGNIVISAPVTVRGQVEGDVNHDQIIDAVDIQLVINAALGIDISPYDADVNGDGTVDSVDVQLIINAAVSK